MNANNVISLDADAALTAYRLVRLTASGTVEMAAAASKAIIGSVQEDTADGDAAAIRTAAAHPIQYICAAGAIAQGAAVKAAAGGKVQDYAGTGDIVGNALEAAAADGDVIRVLMAGTTVAADDAAAAS